MEQEIKEKLDRSVSKLDRPTSEKPGMHQPSAFSTNILLMVSKGIYVFFQQKNMSPPIKRQTHPHSILQVPTTQLAKMSFDPKFVKLTADVLEIFL